MTQHLGQVSLRWNRSDAGIWMPIFEQVHEAHNTANVPPALRKLVSRVLAVSGLAVVDRKAIELVEAVVSGTVNKMLAQGIAVVRGGSDMANYLETEIAEHIFRNTAIFTPPANVYAALYTSDPGETGDDTNEVSESGTAYAREAVDTTSGWDAPSDGATANAADTDFGTATGAGFGTVSHMALTDNATRATGNHFLNGALTASKAVASGDSFKFATGDIDVTFA